MVMVLRIISGQRANSNHGLHVIKSQVWYSGLLADTCDFGHFKALEGPSCAKF